MAASVPEAESPTQLMNYFSKVIDGNPIDTNPKEIIKTLTDDLGIDFKALPERLQEIIPYMFIHYMKHWPGWQKYPDYAKGVLTYAEWYSRFIQYIRLKLTNLIRKTFNEVYGQYYKEELASKMSEVSPVQIGITGPPSLLNSIIFVNIGHDAVIKRHMGPRFSALTIHQIINWPYLEVEFNSVEFAFVRRSVLSVERYLSGTNEKIKFPTTPHIEKAEIATPNLSRQVIALDLLIFYLSKYFEYIEANFNSFKLPKIMEAALEHLKQDIQELKMEDTIATNTLITFNIGKCKYVRSKKVKASPNQDDPVIKYFEIITPKTELHVKYFKAVPYRKAKKDIEFVLFSKDRGKNLQMLPTLKFRCTFCNVNLETTADVSNHFVNEHGMEQLLYCLRCHHKYEVPDLVVRRWEHDCVGVQQPRL